MGTGFSLGTKFNMGTDLSFKCQVVVQHPPLNNLPVQSHLRPVAALRNQWQILTMYESLTGISDTVNAALIGSTFEF